MTDEQWKLLDNLPRDPGKPRYNPMDLNPGKSFLKEKVKELNRQCYEFIKKKNNKEYQIFWPQIDQEHQKALRLIRQYQFFISGAPKSAGLTDLDIARARDYPLTQLYDGKLRKSGTRLFGLCPFHSDKRPSFVLYNTNTYHCFGCQENGDSIAFVMKMNNLKFLEAVRFLIHK